MAGGRNPAHFSVVVAHGSRPGVYHKTELVNQNSYGNSYSADNIL